jgi:hypothetical protein
VRGALRITGYANIHRAHGTFLVAVQPTGQPIPWDVQTQMYNVEFGNSHMVQAKHLISYGGNFRHGDFCVFR